MPKRRRPNTAIIANAAKESYEARRWAEGPDMSDETKITREELKKRIQDAVGAGRVAYQCAFCKEAIPNAEVCALVIVTNWMAEDPFRKEGKIKRSQQWFTHPECFVGATGQKIDVLDSN